MSPTHPRTEHPTDLSSYHYPAAPPAAPTTPSGTHVADPTGDFAAWLTIDGHLCRAYEGTSVTNPRGQGKTVVKCLMGVELGKNFQIHVDTTGYITRRHAHLLDRARTAKPPCSPRSPDLSAEPDLEVRLAIDGRWIASHVVGALAGDRVTTFSGAAVSDGAVKAFRLVGTREFQQSLTRSPRTPTPTRSEIGTIKLSIHRVRKGEPTPAWIPGKLAPRCIPSESLDGAMTCYDPATPLPVPERYYIVRRLPEDKTDPLCTFEITYCTREQLRAMGIVPQ